MSRGHEAIVLRRQGGHATASLKFLRRCRQVVVVLARPTRCTCLDELWPQGPGDSGAPAYTGDDVDSSGTGDDVDSSGKVHLSLLVVQPHKCAQEWVKLRFKGQASVSTENTQRSA